MTDSPHIVRKVRQLDNDVQAIYEMLIGIQATQGRHGSRLDEISAVVESHTATLDQHTATLDQHTAMLTEILGLLRKGQGGS